MKVFFDTEFTGLYKDTSLISIGCITEDNQKFYAEFTDFKVTDVMKNPWIQENVFNNTFFVDKHGNDKHLNPNPLRDMINFSNGDDALFGSKKFVSNQLLSWLDSVDCNDPDTDRIEFVSDVCHYDMVLLIDLLTNGKTALDLPKWICSACYDINSDIATMYEMSLAKAFDKSREGILKEYDLHIPYPESLKHNALYDATVIKHIYEIIRGEYE